MNYILTEKEFNELNSKHIEKVSDMTLACELAKRCEMNKDKFGNFFIYNAKAFIKDGDSYKAKPYKIYVMGESDHEED